MEKLKNLPSNVQTSTPAKEIKSNQEGVSRLKQTTVVAPVVAPKKAVSAEAAARLISVKPTNIAGGFFNPKFVEQALNRVVGVPAPNLTLAQAFERILESFIDEKPSREDLSRLGKILETV